ncbi:DUF2935 domain-containing protein [Clostridium sp.]|uniref:DUF2935 domain-containing protein n=1 Tax=Clostridium sp. TaxID=1506 RepID=UPI003464C019
MNNFMSESIFEHKFWLQILGDHSRFIHTSLSPKEKEFILESGNFIMIFDDLLRKANRATTNDEVERLNIEAMKAAEALRAFKLKILNKMLTNKVEISLPPTFLNHMLNELEEYLIILIHLIRGQGILFNSLHYHILWLLDGSGHAASIVSNLDMIEKPLIRKSMNYEKAFNDLYNKSIELKGYKRTGLKRFNALDQLDQDADNEMTSFKKFLEELKVLVEDNRVLGTIKPLVLDHMIREECYYLTKLSKVANVEDPKCDPTKERVED